MKKQWYEFLTNVNDNQINIERSDTVGSRSGSMLLGYVLKTLDIFKTKSYPRLMEMLRGEGELACKRCETALKWAETSKGLDPNNKEEFLEYTGIEPKKFMWVPHNILSAKIYHNIFKDTEEYDEMVEKLIKYHGSIGQIIRGELSVNEIKNIHNDLVTKDEEEYLSYYMMDEITHAVIEAVSESLWKSIENEVDTIETQLLYGKNDSFQYDEYAVNRFKKIKSDVDMSKINKDFAKTASKYTFWYAESVLSLFNTDDMIHIIDKLITKYDDGYITDVSFKPMADFLYYDYHGKEKRANVYKLRVIENKIKNPDDKNMIWKFSDVYEKKHYMEVSCTLSIACEALVDFCIKAENTRDMTYEGATYLLMDYFKLRHDEFDRLNNEKLYLQTMDDIKNSRKGEILDYTNPYKGETVVDVGSGSGVLLDLLEQRFPEANIVGTDISENCLDTLNHKRISECHKWQVLKHNFVESPLDFEADFVIFSSILHEIYSYTEMNGKKYSLDSVRQALQNAKDSLAYGGTIIIRDGVKSKKSEGRMYLKTKKAREAFLQFVDDFKGNVNKIYSVEEYIGDGCYVWAQDINLLREFACTYTWGTESYSVEVKEQFGYFTLTQYKKELKKLGFTIQAAEEYLEPGYEEHLKDELEFTGGWPATNMIIVASL